MELQCWKYVLCVDHIQILMGKYFNLNRNDAINLVSLSTALEQEVMLASLDAVTLAGVITYQKELFYCR